MTDVLPTTAYEIEAAGDSGRCGAELDRGGTCDRPAGECPWHGEG